VRIQCADCRAVVCVLCSVCRRAVVCVECCVRVHTDVESVIQIFDVVKIYGECNQKVCADWRAAREP